ncbi:flagellin [Methylosinus sp. PW1]|uniref:flagellin N-terminal helical domain-containing protein n=1 Tax=Methylosinus sp. PW1 TaxID=107636 RepID=UPI00068B3DE3|nr:flagellin [Methylosinus sp. PW1]
MSSVLTNSSAITALQNLRSTQSALADTQHRVATGLKVSTAADNPSTWAVAETMKSDRGVVSTIADSLGVSSQIVGVAMAGVESTISVMNQIKSAIAQAAQPGADKAKIATSLVGLSAQLRSIIASASFNGINLLDGSQSSISFASGYVDGNGSGSELRSLGFTPAALVENKTAIASLNASNITVNNAYQAGLLSSSNKSDIFDSGSSSNLGWIPTYGFEPNESIFPNSPTYYDTYSYDLANNVINVNYYANFAEIFPDSSGGSGLGTVLLNPVIEGKSLDVADAVISRLTDYASTLGSTKTTIDSQRGFMRTLGDAMDQGIGSLVDADLNAESTRLQALQTQQQLGVQSLSIANRDGDIVLKLFQ